jgi:Tol biopolymer transport system component/DNA-binding winged helix-turn-helix (wHTH) protein
MLGTDERGSVSRFGAFEFDSRTGELRKHGIRIKLQDQPRQILMMLVERPGEVVSRDDIRQRLWSDGTFVDFDNAINSAVRKLRDALSDTAKTPRFIETIPRQGYRFTPPSSARLPGLQDSEQTTPAASDSRREYRWLLVASVVMMVAFAFIAMLPWDGTREIANIRVAPLTSNPGLESQPSFSPDGTRIAYVWNGTDAKNFSIYTKLIGAGTPVRISTDAARDFSPAWSPDGRWIGALRDFGQQSAVIVFPASGGQHKELARVNKAPAGFDTCISTDWPHICGLVYWGSLLAWSPDGKYLFTSASAGLGSTLAIVRIAFDTGEQHAITAPPQGTVGDFGAAVSPDGRNLGFVRVIGAKTADLYVVSLGGADRAKTEPVRITSDGADVESFAWSHDARELFFSSDRSGRREIWRVGISGSGEPHRLSGMGESALDLAVSRDGKRLVYSRGAYVGSLWKIPIEAGKGGAAVRVTGTTARDKFSHLSPDGKRIAFQSGRSGIEEIWLCDADGGNAVQLTSFGRGMSGSPRWSPDGQAIAFDSNISGAWAVYVIRVAGGRAVCLTPGRGNNAIPGWSRDGRWIYFTSWRSGLGDLWKIHPDGSSETQVTHDGGSSAMESVDGKLLYYKRGDGAADVWKMPVEGGVATKVLSSVGGRLFTVAKDGIYYASGDPVPELRYLHFATGSTRKIALLSIFAHADVSADERWAFYPSPGNPSANLMVVDSFR